MQPGLDLLGRGTDIDKMTELRFSFPDLRG
jgi:hypothetical protein